MSDRLPSGAASRTAWDRFCDWVLTTDRQQRIRMTNSALAAALTVGGVIVMHLLHAEGIVDSRWLWPWSLLSLVGLGGFFVLMRSGWSRRLADPSMTFAQMLFAAAMAAAAYPMAGAGRAVVLPMLSLLLMFGMFGLTARQMLAMAAWVMLVFGVALLWSAATQPERYPPAIEAAHYAMIVLNLFGVVALGARLRDIRRRLQRQKGELELAIERIRVLATHDDLTGLANRRHMQEQMEREAQRSERSRAPLCLALIDLDHFKRINDTWGHAGGDRVLREFADRGQACIRHGDVLGRWGGEEFVLLLPGTALPMAQVCLQRLRDAERLPWAGDAGPADGLRFSAGVAEHRPGDAIVRTLERADAALYAAKDAGRDRVELAP